ncbi:hypothetical protein EFK50_07845 [Nocardioides marmoriginsengisoli]|uniref:HK97 gp10 family phage protein n=1 Tax=Nocardioides marmoriginsengisoli TaxID=661483 RepID=A0A3N0CKU9_9ACTN|nr:hypothetical protein [Nocardioides marmoriginsengisoli]RNL63646.1 hypothetical protein EFK50_07845 [Nocardioides marmoriginsengisoli]
MRIRVTHSIGDLSSDLTEIAVQTRPRMRGVVRDGIKVGTQLSRQFAREKAGPHGSRIWKRINSNMDRGLGLFGNTISGEFGYDGVPKSDFVGAGFRHGINTDLPRAADIVGPSFSRSVNDEVGDMFKAHGF